MVDASHLFHWDCAGGDGQHSPISSATEVKAPQLRSTNCRGQGGQGKGEGHLKAIQGNSREGGKATPNSTKGRWRPACSVPAKCPALLALSTHLHSKDPTESPGREQGISYR